jgi:HD superfamily phosphohydrolase
MNEKIKIFNDPIYGFIQITSETIFNLIEHPYFQRLRRIRQLGLTHLVYPGANHTRFHHAMGSMYLMSQAIDVLRSKGHLISKEESEAAIIAILLHDIGHGPFSHTLEESILHSVRHEMISEIFMDRLNIDLKGKLTLALKIFRNQYSKKFLHQLVSGQLDMDRLDYLNRDSYFTGVSEGVISSDRIIKMLEIHNDEIVIESKGIYSVEKFIIARRLMYWQVYLHKTVVSAENLMINILKRAKELVRSGIEIFCPPSLYTFLKHDHEKSNFITNEKLLNDFAAIDDSDLTSSIKVWMSHQDKILSDLCTRLINRKLFKIRVENKQFDSGYLKAQRDNIKSKFNISEQEIDYYFLSGKLVNNAYNLQDDKINILYPDGKLCDIAEAADTLNIKVLSSPVEKFYISFPGV